MASPSLKGRWIPALSVSSSLRGTLQVRERLTCVNELSSDPLIQAIQAPQIRLHKPSSGATDVAAQPRVGITIPSHDCPSTPAPVRCAQCGNRTRHPPQLRPERLTDRDARTSNALAWECPSQPRQCPPAPFRWFEQFRAPPPASAYETEGCMIPPL